MTNLDPYLAVYFITFVVLILLEVPIAYAMMASAFEFIIFNNQSFVMFAQKTANSLADFNMLALPAFLFVGCFIGSMQILIMVAPLLMNLANALGMSYVQMGVMAVLNVTLGLITPPMAPALFVTAKATGNKFEAALKYTVQFLIPMFITLLLTTFWEPLTMWLPKFLGAV